MQKVQHKRFDKVIRILTVAPLMALLVMLTIYGIQPAVFGNVTNLLLAIACLVVLPLLAYPLQPVLPGWKHKGREGQRTLAILMSVAGYIGGIIVGWLRRVPQGLWVIFLTYLFSGVGILIFNKLLHIRASGHSCGITGPLAFLVYIRAWVPLIVGAVLLVLAFASSLRMKRHTLPQLLWGMLVPVLSFGGAVLVAG